MCHLHIMVSSKLIKANIKPSVLYTLRVDTFHCSMTPHRRVISFSFSKKWLIGHFRVAFSLCVITSLHTWKCVHLQVHFHGNQILVHMKSFAPGLVLKQRQNVTRKWPNLEYNRDRRLEASVNKQTCVSINGVFPFTLFFSVSVRCVWKYTISWTTICRDLVCFSLHITFRTSR